VLHLHCYSYIVDSILNRATLFLRSIGLVAVLAGACAAAQTNAQTNSQAPSQADSQPFSQPAASDPVKAAAPLDEATLLKQRKARLGQRIFVDTNLSEPKGTACLSCHNPPRGMSGDNGSLNGIAQGSRMNVFGTRKAPSLFYAARTPPFGWVEKDGKSVPRGGFFWDGRIDTLAEQAKLPFLAAHEMNNASVEQLVAKVAQSRYAKDFQAVYGEAIFTDAPKAFEAIAESLALLQSTKNFQPFASKFDKHLLGTATLTEQEARGLALFTIRQKGNCVACHAVNVDSKKPSDWLFTDHSYHAVGVPRNNGILANRDAQQFDRGLCDSPKMQSHAQRENYCGWFKVPTLRNIARTAPYMHNAAFATLRDAVAFYATRDTDPDKWYPPSKKFNDLEPKHHKNIDLDTPPYNRAGRRAQLNDEEIDDIVAFLRTLTDGAPQSTR
jgi:cytochrome c peroxidase